MAVASMEATSTLDSQPLRGSYVCTWEVSVEHYQSILCQQPAIVVVDRGQHGKLALCKTHMNEPAAYADVKAHGWKWRVVGR